MKNIKINSLCLLSLLGVILLAGCYKRQTDFDYVKHQLDPHVYMTAKAYLLSRSDNVTGSVDTIFRWMKMGIEYAGIDWSEYEKEGRTYIFLHNSAIKVWDTTTKKVTGGFFYDYPVRVMDINGNPVKKVDGTDSTRSANAWSDYSKETVRNYFLYLILQGSYNFEKLNTENQGIATLLPANTVAGRESLLGFVVPSTTPDPDNQTLTIIDPNGGPGFDPEGKMNLKIANNSSSPIQINDRTNNRTAGILSDNGPIHVYAATVHPFRYSHL